MIETLPGLLRQARSMSRLSQLALSLRVGVSQRHLSFVESGRAKPSRELLVTWLQALNAPLSVRNAALLHAGYAPVYGDASLSDPDLARAHDAIMQLLHAHEPMPALVVDAHWNLVRANAGLRWLSQTVMPWTASLPATTPVNMLDLLIHPDGFLRHVTNLREVGPALLAQLREEASVHGTLSPKVEVFAALLSSRIGADRLRARLPQVAPPMLTTRFATPHGDLAFFSMFTTFGTPQNITLASLRVEHMFAADEATARVVREQVLAEAAVP
jgi:transcriptional regulator with XRE-family HTH domain